MITSLCNLDICSIVRGRAQTWGLGIIDGLILARNQEAPSFQCLLNDLHDTAPCSCTDNSIRLGNLIKELLPVTLTEAARHNETAAASRFLVIRHAKNRCNGLFLRGLDECAGVDNQDIRLRRLIGDLNAMLPHNAEHDLRINEVLCTTETDKTRFH